MEDVYYLVNPSRQDWIYNSFLLKEKTLKQFGVHTYVDSKSRPINLCIEEDNIEMRIESEDKILEVVFAESPYYKDRADEKMLYTFVKSKHKMGIIHPRVYRPFLQDNLVAHTPITMGNVIFNSCDVKKNIYPPCDRTDMFSSINQLHILIENLKSIFLTIHPAKENFNAYGHNIRNLLILACTEVESQFRGILKENGCSKKTYNTKDFVKLLEPLRLNTYTMKLVYYPLINKINPFFYWENEKPTESLSWYKNYNAVKHNRAVEFNKGTLKDVILAISAVAILIFAQYGDRVFEEDPLFNHFLELTYIPKWEISDYYIPPHRENEWKIQGYFENC